MEHCYVSVYLPLSHGLGAFYDENSFDVKPIHMPKKRLGAKLFKCAALKITPKGQAPYGVLPYHGCSGAEEGDYKQRELEHKELSERLENY